jgi:ribosomal-protein-alanine N-acetyltransferase
MPSQFTRLAGYDLPRAAAFAPFAARLPQAAGFPEPLYLRETDAKPSAQTSAPVTRLATSDDLPVLARLHGTCFEAGWNEASLAASLSLPGAMGLVVVADGAVRGFILTQAAADECEILTLCTEPRWRKKGLARRLVEASLQLHKAQAARTMHLEVAADNTAAQALYGSCGFMETGRRKAYYARKNAAAVDAILMSRGL